MNIPQHVGVIIDGNRRWAVKRGLPKFEGHRYGLETLKKLLRAVISRGIPVVSIFIFSTENWRRTSEEVSTFMALIKNAFRDNLEWLKGEGVQVRISGRLTDFSDDVRAIFREVVAATKDNTKLIANFCLSYGGREEITEMAKRVAADTKGDPHAIAAITEETVARHLYTAGLPDVDLLVRTGGERRLSGFLPWQSIYAELYFTDTLWPDFTEEELDRALEFFSTRKRNFGA